jgi:nucleoid-associated protein YgaU
MAPSFDVARIGRDGHAVIAGRATPGAKIVLLDGGKEIARGEADSRGEWVLLIQDPPLAPGQHELRVVQHIEGRAPVTSEQSVVVVVPEKSNNADETLVMIVPPGGAPTLLQSPSAAGVPKSNDLQLSTLDYDDHGHVTISGQALAGSTVRAYIDDKAAAEAVSGKDGHWSMVPADPVDPGKHVLRLDRLGKDGKPVARLELAFERLATSPSSSAAGGDNRKLSIVKGDNLWNIARAHYGEGLQYTIIFNANKDQIRDPDLIYPGQNFSLPKVN